MKKRKFLKLSLFLISSISILKFFRFENSENKITFYKYNNWIISNQNLKKINKKFKLKKNKLRKIIL